ncbi:MAG: hypothetical protein U0Q21_16280 [Dermatophilaceae bacterium]
MTVTETSTSLAKESPTRAARFRTLAECQVILPDLDAAPKDSGTLELVVRRPARGEREVLDVGRLDAAYGLEGDNWRDRAGDAPDPDTQLNIMSHRMVAFLAADPAVEPLAGDQLYLDLDLSQENLPVGTRLAIGDPASPSAVVEVTAKPHTGCRKFVARFGEDAMRFVNGREGRPRRLRGLNARVVTPGEVRPGDIVTVIRP